MAFGKLKDAKVKSSSTQAYEKRSYFQLVSVQQILQGFMGNGWEGNPSEDMKAIIRKRHAGCLATQIVEDENNKMKNHKVIKGKKNSGGPRKALQLPWSQDWRTRCTGSQLWKLM